MPASQTSRTVNDPTQTALDFLSKAKKTFIPDQSSFNDDYRNAKRIPDAKPLDFSTEAGQEMSLYLLNARIHESRICKQLKALRAQEARLEASEAGLGAFSRWLRLRIEQWEANRDFNLFVRLPLELRELVFKEYLAMSRWYWNPFTSKYHRSSKTYDFGFGSTLPISRVCQQLRGEYIDWLVANDPIPLTFEASVWNYDMRVLPNHPQCPPLTHKTWQTTPESLLARIRNVRVILSWRHESEGMEWKLNLGSGTMEVCHCGITASSWPPLFETIKNTRMQAVLEAIVQQGGLRRPHNQWFFEALAGAGGVEEMKAWLEPDAQSAMLEHRQLLEHMPFDGYDIWLSQSEYIYSWV